MMVDGIMDTFPHKPFSLLLSNFSPCPVHVSKKTVIRHTIEAPERILTEEVSNPTYLSQKRREGPPNIWAVMTKKTLNN